MKFSQNLSKLTQKMIYTEIGNSQMKTNLLSQKLRIVGYIGLAMVFGDIISGLAFNYDFDKRIVLIGFILILLS